MIRDGSIRNGLVGLALGLLCLSAGSVRAQDAADLKRLMTRDAVLVSQAIGWSLQGPVSAAEALPVAFTPGAMPKPIATGTMFTHKVMLLDYATPKSEPNRRGLAGVIELADKMDHRVLARFETEYDVVADGTYRVNAVAINEVYPDSPRIEAYVVPFAAFGPGGLTGLSPYAMLDTIRRNAIDPANGDPAAREYRIFVVAMDRLSEQADLGFTAVDATTGREIAKSETRRENGWVVANMPLTFAMNGQGGRYFPIVYRPEGPAGKARILMMFSNRYSTSVPAVAVAPVEGPPLPGLPPAPVLSAVGKEFMAKSYPNQYMPR